MNPSRTRSPRPSGAVASSGVSFSRVLLLRLRWTRVKPPGAGSMRAWTPEIFGYTAPSTATSQLGSRPSRIDSPTTSRVCAGPPGPSIRTRTFIVSRPHAARNRLRVPPAVRAAVGPDVPGLAERVVGAADLTGRGGSDPVVAPSRAGRYRPGALPFPLGGIVRPHRRLSTGRLRGRIRFTQ